MARLAKAWMVSHEVSAPSTTMTLSRLLPLLVATVLYSQTLAVETKEHTFDSKRYMVSVVDLDKEKLHLFLGDGRGNYFNNFENIDRWLA